MEKVLKFSNVFIFKNKWGLKIITCIAPRYVHMRKISLIFISEIKFIIKIASHALEILIN